MQPMVGSLLAICLAGLLPTTGALHASAAASSGAGAAVTPVQKVIEMLGGMLAKGKKEKHDEQVQFAAYKQFCGDTIREKSRAVQQTGEQIEVLKADIQKAETDAENNAQKVQDLNNDIAVWGADIKAATHLREIERTEYDTAHKEYTDTIDAVNRAHDVIKVQAQNRPQAKSVSLLMGAKGLDKLPEVRRVLAAFLASAATDELSPPEAYAYESRSGGILEILQKLKSKFFDERAQIEKEEVNKRHAYELLMQDLKESIAGADQMISEKVQQKAKSLQAAATMKAELEDATTTKADDEKYFSEISATCKQKEGDFDDRQKLRTEEITALEKALEILSGNQVSGTAEKSYAMIQNRGAALVQAHTARQSPEQQRVATYLLEQGDKLNSQVLSALAARVRDDPFTKVKKMIQDLIVRLMEQAGEEAQHKGWCDTELAANEQVRTSRTVEVERLSSEIDGLKSSMAKLSSEVTDLTQQLSDTDQAVATQTKLRNEEKAENAQTLKDAQEAQRAIEQAVTVLREFYAKAAEATALVQKGLVRKQAQPAIFEGAYQGMGAQSGGVIAMLEVIQSDYARLESTTSAMEASSQEEFTKQMSETAVLKAQMEKDIEYKNRLKQMQEQALVDRNNDLASAQKELDAANNYFDKLKPSCLDAGESFEDRAQRRQEEIQSLQEALKILNGEDVQ